MAKPKEEPNDSLARFATLFTSKKRIGSLLKESHTGKVVDEWQKAIKAADEKPEEMDMTAAVAGFMAVKEADELVVDFAAVFE
jgi:nucleosome binding factor SPN SPT16 subunit